MWTANVNLRLHVNSEGENKMVAADLGYFVFAAVIFALTVVFAKYDLFCIIFTNRFLLSTSNRRYGFFGIINNLYRILSGQGGAGYHCTA
jgi:hypothetical protein